MAKNFSVNQVRHLYVATAEGTVSASSNVGTIQCVADNAKTHLYFKYMGKGGQVRSDLIDIKDILHVKATPASAMATSLKKATITLDANVNGGEPVAGQDYIVRIAIKQFVNPSDESDYIKYGVARAKTGMTDVQLYTELAASLFRNFSREAAKLVEIEVGGKVVANVKTVNGTTTLYDSTNTAITATTAGIAIKEVEQEWKLGITEQVPVYFDVIPTTITYEGDEVEWGNVALATAGTVGNGKKIADLEYFCMGERGDVYRNVGWPNVIPTEYMVDPTKTYNVLDIHYAYVGPNEGPQRSEKTITIVADSAATTDIISALVGDINTATGLSIDDLA